MVTTSALRLASPIASSTQASTVYDRLREDLLSGRLEPGRKLQMRFLTETYQTGQTPLREALNRLTADGLVECREQRGFYVASISRNELVELTKTRCWVESLALRESMAGLDPAMGRAASARGASSWPNAAFAQRRTLRRQSGVGTAASRLPQNADRQLRLAVVDRVLRTARRPALQIPAPVDPESLSIPACGRRTSSDHVSRLERRSG